MINVGKVCIETKEKKTFVYCDYEIDGSANRLWFEVDQRYSEYLSSECGDAFFLVLVLLAHLRRNDISFITPVSTRLFYGVNEILLPALRILEPDAHIINVTAATKDFGFEPIGSGTALSLGVDSFHAVASSFKGPYQVTHLALFNSGAFGDYGGEEARGLFLKTAKALQLAAAELELPLVLIDSNISEVLEVSFAKTHSIRNLSFSLLLPGLFRTFFYASGYPVCKFRLDPSIVDATHYDLLISKAVSTESLEIMVAGLHDSRIQKISMLARFPTAQQHLNVCILAESNAFLLRSDKSVKNCSRCFKCVKTMVALDVLGVLGSYSKVFDLSLYRSKRPQYLGWILYDALKLKSEHAIEIVREGRKTKGFFPCLAYIFAITRVAQNIFRKIRVKQESK